MRTIGNFFLIILFTLCFFIVAKPVSATTFVNDTFTETGGTNLSAHTGETGATWVQNSAATGPEMVITSSPTNAIRNGSSGSSDIVYYASGTPGTADYDVAATFIGTSNSSSGYVGVVARSDTSAKTFYLARYFYSLNQWQLIKFVSGSATSLGSSAQTLSNGTSYSLVFSLRGNDLSVYVDGVLKIAARDTSITTAGRVGVAGVDTGTATDANEEVILGDFTASTANTFSSDTFTGSAGTLLENHTGETGATWTKSPSQTGSIALTANNQARNNSSSGAFGNYYSSGTPSSADYDVEADFTYLSLNSASQLWALIGRQSTSANTFYWATYNSGWAVYKVVAGTTTQLGSTSSQTLAANQTYHVKLSMRGSNIALIVDGVSKVVTTDSAISAAGRAGISTVLTGNSDSVGVTVDNFVASERQTGGPLTAGTLSNAIPGASSVSLSWSAAMGGTAPYTYQVQRAADSGGSPGSYSNLGSSQAGTTYTDSTITTTTAYWYRVNITDSASATATTNAIFVPMASRTTVSVTDSNIYFTPQNWYINGSSYARTNVPGAYFKLGFTGTTIMVNVDESTLASEYPIIAYSIDGGALSRITLSSATTINLTTTPLSTGSHQLVFYVDAIGIADRWTTPTDQVTITGVTLDNGASTVSPTLKDRRILIYGDSHTEGAVQLGSDNIVSNIRWTTTWNKLMADSLDAEISSLGYQGIGFKRVPPITNVPAFPNMYNLYSAGLSRTMTPAPDYVILALGANDASSSLTQAEVQSNLDLTRTAFLNAVIILSIPLNQASTPKTSMTNAFNAQSDPNVYLIDAGSSVATIITNNSTDGSHPTAVGHSLIEDAYTPLFIDKIDDAPAISSVSSGTPTSTAATITWTTDKTSSSQVQLGPTTSYGRTTTEADITSSVTSHSVALTSLPSCTTFHYRVKSTYARYSTGTGSDGTFSTTCPGGASVTGTATSTITVASGGSLSLSNLSLTIPANVTGDASTVDFQASKIDSASFISSAGSPSGKTLLGTDVYDLKAIYDGTSTISSFSQPITVTMTYSASDVGSLTESALAIYRYDGSSWSTLSNCSVDTGARTVSCTTTQFSDFAIFGSAPSSSSSSSSTSSPSTSSSPSTPSCNDQTPNTIPDLFQIDVAGLYANLYFTKADGNVNGYSISYGLTKDASQYGDNYSYSGPLWIINRTISSLLPNTTYFFKVRALNGCTAGNFGKVIEVKTPSRFAKIKQFFANLNPFKSKSHSTKTIPQSQPATSTNKCQYTVKSGDSLWKIASENLGGGANYSQVINLNPNVTKATILRPGQMLQICK